MPYQSERQKAAYAARLFSHQIAVSLQDSRDGVRSATKDDMDAEAEMVEMAKQAIADQKMMDSMLAEEYRP